MAVYYKFKSARDYDSIPIDGHFISVANLKERIFESKHLGRGTDFDLMVSNAQTDEEYADEATLIPKNTSVLVRRIPGRPRKPIITQQEEQKSLKDKVEEEPQPKSTTLVADSSAMKFQPEEADWDEFGTDLYAIPEVVPTLSSNAVASAPPSNQVDEESKIKALVDTPALDWQRQVHENYGPGRGYGRGMGGRVMAGRGFGRGGGLEKKTPPPGYICHRCKVPGHFIQHCPTNGDPNYDIKRVKPPTGIPKSMLMATPDGSYALPSGAVAVLRPNEAAFEKEIEGLPSIRHVTDLPPELRCPLCKEVMKDAVLTSKCCFSSFCDKCIRDYIISKSVCVCGFTNILADDLLPNKTLRETISRIMESTTTSSAENAGSLVQVQDMESARPLPPKASSPTLSATKECSLLPSEPPPDIKQEVIENDEKQAVTTKTSLDKSAKHADQSEATLESMSAKEPTSQESAPVPDKEAQEKMLANEQGKKKKKKKVRVPGSAPDMQWRSFQDMGVENYAGMPMAPSAYNSYFGGMPWGMDGYMAPFPGTMPLMGSYPQVPFDVPFGMLPQDPFAGPGYMMPPHPFPQRDLSELAGLNKNPGPPIMSRGEFEARKADLRRNRENERLKDRERSRDRESSRDRDLAENSSLRPRPKLMPQASVMDRVRRGKSPLRPSSSARDTSYRDTPPPPPPPSQGRKQKPDQKDEVLPVESSKPSDRKQKASVFSRISFPDSSEKEGGNKKKKKSAEPPNGLRNHPDPVVQRPSSREELKPTRSSSIGGATRKSTYDHELSEEEYHFKRRPSSSQHEVVGEGEDEARSTRVGRERERTKKHDDRHAKRIR